MKRKPATGRRPRERRGTEQVLPPRKFAPSDAAWSVTGGFLFLCLLGLPEFVAANNLDESWQQAYAYFLAHGFRAGIDYAFTLGPLGYFATTAYQPELFAAKYAWELLFSGLLAFELVVIGRQLPRPALPAYLLGLLLVAAIPRADARYSLQILITGIFLTRADERPWWQTLLAVLLLAALSLGKFTLMLSSLVVLLIAEAALRSRRPRSRRSPLLMYLLVLAGSWLMAGQPLAGFGPYLRFAWESASGYTAGMGWEGPSHEALLGLVVLLCTLAALAGILLKEWRGERRFGPALMTGAIVFTGWKHGITRHDAGHLVIFFLPALIIPFLVWLEYRNTLAGRQLPTLLLAGGWAAAVAFFLAHGDLTAAPGALARRVPAQARALLQPGALRKELEERRAALRAEWSLPGVRAVVGSEGIDIFSHEQGVLLLNGLNWRPRPVFQSYSAYTPALARANVAALRRADAAPYLLMKLSPIDLHLPTAEDGLTLLEVLRRYRPVLVERDYALFRREPAAPAAEPEARVVTRTTVRAGEPVSLAPLPGEYQTLSLRLFETPLGRLRKLVYRPPDVFLRLLTNRGRVRIYRIRPATAPLGVLIDPLVLGTASLMRLYDPGGARPEWVTQVEVLPMGEEWGRWYQDRIEVTVRAAPRPPLWSAARVARGPRPRAALSLSGPPFRPSRSPVLPGEGEFRKEAC